MTREEDAALAQELLERSNSTSEAREVSNEEVWQSLKRNILNLSEELNNCVTEEEIKKFSRKSDSFNKFATNTLKGISDDYAEKNRATEYALREEDIRVRKAHEINDAIRLTQTSNPEAANAIITGMMSLLGSNMSVPKEMITAKKVEQPVDEIIADVTLSED